MWALAAAALQVGGFHSTISAPRLKRWGKIKEISSSDNGPCKVSEFRSHPKAPVQLKPFFQEIDVKMEWVAVITERSHVFGSRRPSTDSAFADAQESRIACFSRRNRRRSQGWRQAVARAGMHATRKPSDWARCATLSCRWQGAQSHTRTTVWLAMTSSRDLFNRVKYSFKISWLHQPLLRRHTRKELGLSKPRRSLVRTCSFPKRNCGILACTLASEHKVATRVT